MGRRLQLSAIQLVVFALLGSALVACLFVLPQPFGRWFDAMGWPEKLLCDLPILVLGIAIMWVSQVRFSTDVQNERWSEEELAPLRAVLLSPWLTVFSVVMLIASVVLFISAHQYRGFGWAILIFSQSLTRLQMAFKKPTPNTPSGPNWSGMSPINSEHWGER